MTTYNFIGIRTGIPVHVRQGMEIVQTADSHCDPGSWNYMYAISFIILYLDAADYFAVFLPHRFNNIHPTTRQ